MTTSSFDARQYRAGPGARVVATLSHGDVLQLLCECIEALEQFEGHALEMTGLCDAWRRDRLEASSEHDSAAPVLAAGSGWQAPPAVGADADGVCNLLPARYATDGYLWQHRNALHAVPVASLDKAQAQQALCQTLEVLARLERELFGLQRLLGDWKAGTMRPTSDFDIAEQ